MRQRITLAALLAAAGLWLTLAQAQEPASSDLCLERGGELEADVDLNCPAKLLGGTAPPVTQTITPTPTTEPTNTPAATSTATATFNTPTVTPTFDYTPCEEPIEFAAACYSGDGEADRDVITCFEPDFVWVLKNTGPGGDNQSAVLWVRDLGDDASVLLGGSAAGVLTNRITDTTTIGFQVGTDDSVNTAGDHYCFVAGKHHPEMFASGTYVGDGDTGARSIALPFEPDVAIVVPITGPSSGARSRIMMRGASKTNWLQRFISISQKTIDVNLGPGFEFRVEQAECLAGSCSLNVNTEDYAYLAFAEKTSYTDQGLEIGAGESTHPVATSCDRIGALMLNSGFDDAASPAGDEEYDFCRLWAVENDLNCPWSAFVAAPPAGGSLSCEGLDSIVNNLGSFNLYNTASAFEVSCIPDQTEIGWFAVCGSATAHELPVNTFQNAGEEFVCNTDFDATAAADWTDDFIAVWDFEAPETLGSTAVAEGSCSTDCDLTDHNTVTRTASAGEFITGAQAAQFSAINSEYLSCPLATCDELDLGGAASSFTFGAWWRVTTDASTRYVMSKGDTTASTDAYWMARFRGTSPDRVGRVGIRASGGTLTQYNLHGNIPIHQWVFMSLAFDNAGNTTRGIDGAFYDTHFDVGSTSAYTDDLLTGTAGEFNLGRLVSTAGGFWDGFVDMAYIYGGVLSPEDTCRIASCGIDGALCECYDATPTVYKVKGYNEELDNCTLPACNKAAPS